MKYLILIIFIMLSALTEEIYTTSKARIEEQVQEISRLSNIIGLLENHYTRPENFLFSLPMHEEDYLRITSPYGYRQLINPFTGGTRESIHKGVDYLGTHNYLGTHKARIIAIASGIVIEHYPPPDGYYKGHKTLGGMIKIDHGNNWTAVYGHMSSTYVREGQFVHKGAVIGRQGDTGLSLGDHLHFELRYNDDSVQPLKFVGRSE